MIRTHRYNNPVQISKTTKTTTSPKSPPSLAIPDNKNKTTKTINGIKKDTPGFLEYINLLLSIMGKTVNKIPGAFK